VSDRLGEPGVKGPNRFTTRDLLVIAVLSGLGGVMSTYIGYLGNMMNQLVGVPFGAGQFVSGLHVVWLVLAAGLVRARGVGTVTGLLKGVVEFLTGSTHGSVIIIVCLIQGIVIDLIMGAGRKRTLLRCAFSGAAATAANVIVFQVFYFSGAGWGYLALVIGVSLLSGAALAGVLGYHLLQTLRQIRPVKSGDVDDFVAAEAGTQTSRLARVLTVATALAFVAGSVFYFATVYQPPWAGTQCRVEGLVENPITFKLSHFKDAEKTINVELRGQVTYVPAQDYTGVSVPAILAEAGPKPEATTLKVVATDGYEVKFELDKVMSDDKMLLVQEEDDTFRLIAGNYEGGYWVRQVSKLVVE
jgi:ABC-type thiamin/hydroxymethylpyrimidine transport system permease subunit